MKVLLHSRIASPSLLGRYRFAEQVLRSAGIESEIRTGVEPGVGAENVDVLLSYNCISDEVRDQLKARCFGGKRMSRPEHLTLLASLGFPTMEWTTVKNQSEAMSLFDSLEAPRLILKRSFTGGGTGFHVLTKNQPRYTDWDYENDIICKEVNPDDGYTYKAELFAGELMLSFVLKKAPLRERLGETDDCPKGVRQLAVYRNERERPDERHRSLFEFSESESALLENLSAALTQLGFGYVSVDLMRRPDGELVAIEINTGSITTWWSERFPFVRERFAASLLNLVSQN
jgi:hypothetical protein